MTNNEVYIKIPCELFRGFASTAEMRQECIDKILDYAIYFYSEELGDIAKACNFLNIRNENNAAVKWANNGKRISRSISGKCYFSVCRDTLFEFKDKPKTFNQSVLLLGFLALRSIQGKARYFKASNGLLLARMDGQDKPQYIETEQINSKTGEKEIFRNVEGLQLHCHVLARYATKYKMAQLRELLHKYYGVSFYTPKAISRNGTEYSRKGFYFSVTMNQEELIREVEFGADAKLAKKKGGLKSETESILEKIRNEKKG